MQEKWKVRKGMKQKPDPDAVNSTGTSKAETPVNSQPLKWSYSDLPHY